MRVFALHDETFFLSVGVSTIACSTERLAAGASAVALMQDRMNIASTWAQDAFEALLSRSFAVTDAS
jgi:hypothetical protein